MEAVVGMMIPIAISLGAFVMIIFIRKYENSERLKMIENGINPKDMENPKKDLGVPLKFALIAGGIGIGLLIGNVLDTYTQIQDEVAYFSMCFIFGGIGLFVADYFTRKRLKREEAEKAKEGTRRLND